MGAPRGGGPRTPGGGPLPGPGGVVLFHIRLVTGLKTADLVAGHHFHQVLLEGEVVAASPVLDIVQLVRNPDLSLLLLLLLLLPLPYYHIRSRDHFQDDCRVPETESRAREADLAKEAFVAGDKPYYFPTWQEINMG